MSWQASSRAIRLRDLPVTTYTENDDELAAKNFARAGFCHQGICLPQNCLRQSLLAPARDQDAPGPGEGCRAERAAAVPIPTLRASLDHPADTEGTSALSAPSRITNSVHSSTLADVLERILDKGLVIAGDIKVKLVDIELLTIQIRLVVASVDKAREMGLDWWTSDLAFSPKNHVSSEVETLHRRLEQLENRLSQSSQPGTIAAPVELPGSP